MNAILLAAGRGERMRPLTDTTPKALLEVGGKPLIVWHLEKFATAGFRRVIINCAHLGAQIEATLGDGARYGIEIAYSRERCALETAGGIANALPLLDSVSFAAVNADVYSEYQYAKLAATVQRLSNPGPVAHLILVENPRHHPGGDFALQSDTIVPAGRLLTFSGIAAYRSEMFAGIGRGTKAALAPLLRQQIAIHGVNGEHFRGRWYDVGTPERLVALNIELAAH